MTNESSAFPKKAFELVKRSGRHSGVLEDIDSRLTNALTSKDDPTFCNLPYENFTRKLFDLEVVLRQMVSIDHHERHEIEFKSAPTRSSSRSSQSSRAAISNTRPPSESEPTYTIPTNVASPMDLSAPLNLDPVSIAATFHLSQNVTSNPTSLYQMDLLHKDFLRPTTIRFAETDTGNTFSIFQHNSIQRPSPQIPLNPLFISNPQNTFSQHPSHEPCDLHGPSAVRFSVGSVVPTHHSPLPTTTAASRTTPAPSARTSHQLCERSPFELPDIKLDCLDGNPMLWPDWFAMFQSAIDSILWLSESEKHTYLQTLVSGSTKKAIGFYGCNPQFYKTAVDELCRRFGHPKHVVKSFLSELQKFPAPHLSSPSSSISFSAFLRKLVRTFKNLQFDSDLRSSFLLETAVAKLPAAVHMKWNEYNITSFPNGASLRVFSEWLTVYARACELWRYAWDYKTKRPRKCPDFLKKLVQERINFVRCSNLCFNCLSPRHKVEDCKSTVRCQGTNCGKWHHTSLHRENKDQRPLPPNLVILTTKTHRSKKLPQATPNLPKTRPLSSNQQRVRYQYQIQASSR